MITIVVGGQYGSEAKGAITEFVCRERQADLCVRTGGINAGHSVVYNGVKFAMQQIPVGWTNPDTTLVIGAGALVHPEVLARECAMVSEATGRDVHDRLFVDYRAGIHLPNCAVRSAESGRHHAMGATGKGCSEALMDRMRGRAGSGQIVRTYLQGQYNIADTVDMLNHAANRGSDIVLEGTQGTLLDFYTGPYPFVTHRSTLPGALMAEAGLSPRLEVNIIMVVRTYPIRVAGNSGPLPNETSWPKLARSMGYDLTEAGLPAMVQDGAVQAFEEAVIRFSTNFSLPLGSDGLDQYAWTATEREEHRVALSELNKVAWNSLAPDVQDELLKVFELTTVTKKLRRVGRLALGELTRAARLVRPTQVAVTFMNHYFPQYWGAMGHYPDEHEVVFLRDIARSCEAPVTMLNYGPAPEHIARLREGIR